ncbi:P-loop containing nucleoside triphosphate hydrolases superfamily protein [Tasmannia lanceolata]|uniref:P-loop containing nucleoside triphosphate hydrolases superfamily protein n=1 Tax=Tasmannia lanceolata TaxID=3420 RepID=UPI004063B56B
MANEAPPPSSKKKSKKRLREKSESNHLNVLPWNESLSNDDPLALLVGTNEGGFLSLEEIDESEYGFLPDFSSKTGEENPSFSSKSEKRKRLSADGSSGDDSSIVQAGSEEEVDDEKKVKRKKKKKKKTKDKLKKKKSDKKVAELDLVDLPFVSHDEPKDKADNDFDGESVIDEEGFYAWKELRLHPLLMKSIHMLGFKEPTPIQKACIPVAAHQGKDVIGAAETGSGKTLAFGLPILQRLLQEREKDASLLRNKGKLVDNGVQESPLRALVITPTRELAIQVSDHLKEVAKFANVNIVPIVGGMSTEKQERLLKRKPEIIVGTPGRLWELMSGRDQHLVELHSLSFFVLDEADRMIENGHFHELQSIIDMLPTTSSSVEEHSQVMRGCETISSLQRKKRQTFVFSATIALSASFRKKLKRGSHKSKPSLNDGMSSIETLSERAGMRADAAVVDLTNASIMADKIEESFIECREEDKEAYLYYLLSIHGHGRTIVFCTSIAALRRISSLLKILGINVWTLHAQMQQRARLKAIDRFRGSEHGILVATDVAARGLDIPGVRTVIHYQLPHSAEVYVHRSGRTARASADGCCIALISPSDRSKFAALCKSFSKESLQRFPLDNAYMPEVEKRVSLARQIDKILRTNSQEKAKKSWFERNAESLDLVVEDSGSEEERVNSSKQKKISSFHLRKLQQDLSMRLARPFQSKSFSRRFLAGAGVSPILQRQLEELARQKVGDDKSSKESKRTKLAVIGQDCIEPLQVLRSNGHEFCVGIEDVSEKRKKLENRKIKKREEKRRVHDQRRKQRRNMKEGNE